MSTTISTPVALGTMRRCADMRASDPGETGGSVAFDLVCRDCGYNLRTLNWKARCPECGLDVAASKLPVEFRFSSWRSIRRLKTGLQFLVIAVLVSVILKIAVTGLVWNWDRLLHRGWSDRQLIDITLRGLFYGDSTRDFPTLIGILLIVFAISRRCTRQRQLAWFVATLCGWRLALPEAFGWGAWALNLRESHPVCQALMYAPRTLPLLAAEVLFWTLLPSCERGRMVQHLRLIMWVGISGTVLSRLPATISESVVSYVALPFPNVLLLQRYDESQ